MPTDSRLNDTLLTHAAPATVDTESCAAGRCDPWGSRRLWSLADMLKVSLAQYLDLGAREADFIALLYILEDKQEVVGALASAAGERPSKRIEEMASDEKGDFVAHLERMARLCEVMGLPVSKELLVASLADQPETEREFRLLMRAVRSELTSKVCVCIPQHVVSYYENDRLVTDTVKNAFPLASGELRNAGNCMALELPTACVFFSMRAAEIGVRSLGTALGIATPHPIELCEWQVILNGINTALRAIENQPRTTQRDADLEFYGTAAAQFRFFKDGWRIRVAHARATYNETQAREAIDHVRAFFETISHRLSE